MGIFERVATLDFFAPTADAERPNFSPQMIGDIAETPFDLAIDLRVDADTRVGNRSHPPAFQAAGFAGIMGSVRLARAAAMRLQA